MNTISEVVQKGMCHGCGICAAICPVDAVDMKCEPPGAFVPRLNEDRCTHCGLCLDGCSGKDAFGGDSLVGDVTGVWTGHAADESIRAAGASGGIVSAILIQLLETRAIDAAVICAPDQDCPVRGRSFVARSPDEIILGAKSIYGMTEIGTGLREALKDNQIKRMAVVGLPCQIASARRACDVASALRSKTALLIGIMDGHNVYHKATEYALRQLGIRLEDVAALRYRAYGWSPYFTEVITRNGKRYKIPFQESPFGAVWNAWILVPRRCLLCNDFAAEAADVAVSDAWLPRYEGSERGYSIVLTHTERGADLIQNLRDCGCLDLARAPVTVIGVSQYRQLDAKKRAVAARARILGLDTWLRGRSTGEVSVEDYVAESLMILRNWLVRAVPAVTWRTACPGAWASRGQRLILHLALRLYDRISHGKRTVWKHQVEFGPDILAQGQLDSAPPAADCSQ